MLLKQVNTCERRTPLPISLLIDAAKSYSCNIFIYVQEQRVNVKDYDDLISNLRVRGKPLVFSFDGDDEQDAQLHIERLFRQ